MLFIQGDIVIAEFGPKLAQACLMPKSTLFFFFLYYYYYFLTFLLFIYFLFYFTILYWFCHTSTCICHGCTRVPHPEPPLPPPSPYHPSGSSQCTSPEHPVSCIKPGLVIHFLYDIIHVSMPFSAF